MTNMMSEAAQKIHECIAEIEYYQYDAPDLTVPAINSLKECATLITRLTEENRVKALVIAARLYQQALAYAQYVPTSVRNLRALKEWLEAAE